MNKLFFSVVAMGLLSSSAFAAYWVNGKVYQVRQYGSNTVIVLKRNDGTTASAAFNSSLSSEAKKALLAMALTAKASDADVSLRYDAGWNAMFYK